MNVEKIVSHERSFDANGVDSHGKQHSLSSKSIPRSFLDPADRYEARDGIVDFRGVVSHVNYRRTGKTDIGSAFDWNRVIEGVQA